MMHLTPESAHGRCPVFFDFQDEMLHGAQTMTAEEERTRLIGEIARVLREDPVSEEVRCAALTFIGWLARRMPGEPVSLAGVREMVHERSSHRESHGEPALHVPHSRRMPRSGALEEAAPNRRAR
jgi:hypothetical protein